MTRRKKSKPKNHIDKYGRKIYLSRLAMLMHEVNNGEVITPNLKRKREEWEQERISFAQRMNERIKQKEKS